MTESLRAKIAKRYDMSPWWKNVAGCNCPPCKAYRRALSKRRAVSRSSTRSDK